MLETNVKPSNNVQKTHVSYSNNKKQLTTAKSNDSNQSPITLQTNLMPLTVPKIEN